MSLLAVITSTLVVICSYGLGAWMLDPPLPCGQAMLGGVTSTHAALWGHVCSSRELHFDVLCEHTNVSTHWSAPVDADGVGSVHLDSLLPNTTYNVMMAPGGQRLRFRTLPGSEKEAFSFAFGSCMTRSVFPWHSLRIPFEAMLQLNPRFLFLLGDNAYVDVHQNVPVRLSFSQAYRQVLSDEWVARALARLPAFAMLDDHELENGFTGRSHALFDTAMENWHKYWGWRNPPRHEDDDDLHESCHSAAELWFHFRCGHAASFFVAETRLNADPGVSRLGARQVEALKGWALQEHATSTFLVVASPVSWSADGHGLEFEEEREDIFDFLEEHMISSLMIVSGDMHYGAMYSYREGLVFEYSASPLQAIPFPTWLSPHTPRPGYARWFFHGMAFHFGTLEVDPSERAVTFTLFQWSVFAGVWGGRAVVKEQHTVGIRGGKQRVLSLPPDLT